MRRKHRDDEETSIDMTPMLDIVFIMLIFFIVTTSFIKEQATDLSRPSKSQKNPNPPKDPPPVIIISIDDASNVTMDDGTRLIDLEAVGANVEAKLSENPLSPVLIRVHADAKNETMIRSLDQARNAGVKDGQVSVARWITGKK